MIDVIVVLLVTRSIFLRLLEMLMLVTLHVSTTAATS